jgi:hypothetical protein
MSEVTPKQPSALKSFLCGGVGGACLVRALLDECGRAPAAAAACAGPPIVKPRAVLETNDTCAAAQVLVGHPLDTIKVRIQTMELVPGQPPPYTGMVDCASKIVKKEGVSALVAACMCACVWGWGSRAQCFLHAAAAASRCPQACTERAPVRLGALAPAQFNGLYRGMAAPLGGVAPMYALCFLGYGIGKNLFCDNDAFEKGKWTQIGLAGAFSSFFTTPILGPGASVDSVVLVLVACVPLVACAPLPAVGGLCAVGCDNVALAGWLSPSAGAVCRASLLREAAKKPCVVVCFVS